MDKRLKRLQVFSIFTYTFAAYRVLLTFRCFCKPCSWLCRSNMMLESPLCLNFTISPWLCYNVTVNANYRHTVTQQHISIRYSLSLCKISWDFSLSIELMPLQARNVDCLCCWSWVSWHCVVPSGPTKHCLNAIFTYSVVAGCVYFFSHPLM